MIYTVTLNPALDYVVWVDELNTGKVNRTESEKIFPGGKGINVSIVLKNMGYDSLALGFVAGFTGNQLIRELQQREIRSDFISVDGGMTDNIRPALYQAVYTGVIANKADEEKTEKVTVCGKCCESGDILITDLDIATPEAGDTFAIFSTGAYGYTMASNYNKNTIPGVVFVKDGVDRVVVKPQTYDDMLANEIL